MPVAQTFLGTRDLTLDIGGDLFTAEISNCRITSAAGDSDFTSFADAKAGGKRVYTLVGTVVQNVAEGSIWDMVWNNAGETVPVVLMPNGGTAVSATTPKVTGNVVITEPDGDILGGEANASTTARFTMEISWTFEAKPVFARA
ncbi:hypothetical protein [Nocardioides sp. GXZ039]|uniref:hypothetical protein n=1 Tax=Nocardioides sp. GXZ039 TaxID=3136018 RepID=UPI0030F49BA5